MGRNNADFHGVTFSHVSKNNTATHIFAQHPEHGEIGRMSVLHENGIIGGVYVDERHRRKGVATGMFNYAKQLGLNPTHSTQRTDDGDAWAKTVGGAVPEKKW